MKGLGRLFDIVPVVVPVDLQTAQSGDYVSMKGAHAISFVIFKAAGTAGDDPDFTIRQAKTAAGGSVKDLDAVATIYKKQGTLTAVGTWSKVTQTADALFSADATSAEEQAVYVIEINAEDLDVDNGFDYVTCNVADTGTNAQLGCVLAILHGLRDATAPENLASAIA